MENGVCKPHTDDADTLTLTLTLTQLTCPWRQRQMLRVGGAAVVHPVGQRSRVGQGSRVGRSYGEAATSICGVCATCATTTPCPYLEVCIADSASAYTHAVSMMRIYGCFPGLGPPSPLSLCGASVWVAVWPFGQLVAILTIPFASHICLCLPFFFPCSSCTSFFCPSSAI